MSASMIFAWIGVVLGTAIASACAASDGALLALDVDGPLPPDLRALYTRRERAHRALAFARVMAQLTAGVSVAVALDLAARSRGADVLVGMLAALVLVGASESLARSMGSMGGGAAAIRMFPFIRAVERLLVPIAALGGWFDVALHRLLPPPSDAQETREATADQFRQVVAAEADVTKDQAGLLTGVFRLRDTEVHEIMVPRVDVVAIDRDTPWSEVVDRVRSSEHSRLPVFHQTIDDIIGILFAKDLLPIIVADEVPDDWTAFLRPAVFIPGAKKADAQLREFQASGTHIAIVADEFGGTAGLMTIEDVLEEIVGDIRDENDEEESPIEREGESRFWVSARVTLGELSDVLGVDFTHEELSTVGGLVYEILGRVPRAGEELTLHGFRIVVERVIRRRVQRVYFERLEDPEPQAVEWWGGDQGP
ncbi:MAG: hemolysin family protein [Gemmatimonadaceae bacterium]